MAIGKYHAARVKPNINLLGNVAYAASDVLFDWHAFEIPNGTAKLVALELIVAGTNGADANVHDMDLLFATSVNGTAPPTLGGANAALTLINSTASRNHIVHHRYLDGSSLTDLGDFIGYNFWSNKSGALVGQHAIVTPVIAGEPNYGTQGYQTIWIAAIAQGAFDFGTGCIAAGDNAADNLGIVIDGVDADDVFAIGDTVIAFDADGSGATEIGNVTALSADLITVDAAATLIADDDEICNLSPITFNLGFEY
mgnify:FL=1|tara:strand:- start:40 stop:801 length:762 start_codon:yes stop_codon:yes gene_type:complete